MYNVYITVAFVAVKIKIIENKNGTIRSNS